MPMEEPGLQKQPIEPNLFLIISHIQHIRSICLGLSGTKSYQFWCIDREIYCIFALFLGGRIRTLKPEERVNGYTIGKN
jgi:hypothetical protein